MSLRVSGKNLAIGEALRSHVQTRIDSVAAKYHAGAPRGHVTIEPEGSGFRADCTLFLRAGITLQVEAIAHEPYASFDKAAERIERRLRDHRKRTMSRHADDPADGMLRSSLAEAIALPPLETLEDQEPEAEETFAAIIAEHPDSFDVRTVAAAVRALDSTDCPVVIFRSAENKRINLVYRRPDGNIGWIDPLGAANGHSP